MEISAQNTPLLTLQWKQAASRLLENKILADYCYFSTHKDTNGSDEALEVLRHFCTEWRGKRELSRCSHQGDDYLFICMFVYLRVNNCE